MSGVDRIVLNLMGFFYCICLIFGYCEIGGGMKFFIYVMIIRVVVLIFLYNGIFVVFLVLFMIFV